MDDLSVWNNPMNRDTRLLSLDHTPGIDYVLSHTHNLLKLPMHAMHTHKKNYSGNHQLQSDTEADLTLFDITTMVFQSIA